ncbi:RNA-directed DNA polymerase from mobile element jockey [Exaiptasia diaphana]|nr:RNA-directed DNA polymerase from mobile element jockey [Exaiptasia diaphana]
MALFQRKITLCWPALEILDRRVPKKKLGTWNNAPWISRDLKRLLRKKKRLYNLYKKTNNPADKQKYRKFQKHVKEKLRKAQEDYIAESLNIDPKDKPKRFWSYIKAKKQDQIGIPPLKSDSGLKVDSLAKAETLNAQFQKVFTQEDVSSIPNKGPSNISAMGQIIFDAVGIKNLLQGLNSKKANGPDNIPTRLIKETATEISEVVCFLFNQSYRSGRLPSDWCKANIVPIFKKGKKQDPSNYRPVSLTVTLCKVMEHIIYRNIMQHLEHNNILYANQHGFRKNHSCETQLLSTIEDLAKNLDDGAEIDLQIFDFSKAFDKVPHQRLLSKLDYYGIQDKTLAWINSWLTGRFQRVVVDGEASSLVKVTSGVPQGTVLGPLMFLLFINDIHENLNSNLKLFADDALLYRTINTVNDGIILQNDIDKLAAWGRSWQMQFNVTKCHTMRITRKKEPVLIDYYIDGRKLSPVTNHPYLGVSLSSDLKWNTHVNNIVAKANKSLGFVKRNLYSCTERTKRTAYVSIVRPTLEYATAVWDPYRQEQIDAIEAVQRRAARFIKNDYNRSSSVTEMLKCLDLDQLQDRRPLCLFYFIG